MPGSIYPAAIRSLALFNGIPEQDRDALLKGGRIRHIAAGGMLFAQGDDVRHFYVLTEGVLQLFRTTPDGSEKTIAIIKSGQSFGESEILDACHGHRANGVAVDAVTLMEFPAAWVKEAARKYPSFALNLLTAIAQQAHEAELEAEHQATLNAAQLVACFLQRLCVLYDFNPSGFELPYAKTLIASRLGMEPETLSRTLAALKRHGIEVQGTHVVIRDIPQLEQFVCQSCSVSESCATHEAVKEKLYDTPQKIA